jgi:hypothetical protein
MFVRAQDGMGFDRRRRRLGRVPEAQGNSPV